MKSLCRQVCNGVRGLEFLLVALGVVSLILGFPTLCLGFLLYGTIAFIVNNVPNSPTVSSKSLDVLQLFKDVARHRHQPWHTTLWELQHFYRLDFESRMKMQDILQRRSMILKTFALLSPDKKRLLSDIPLQVNEGIHILMRSPHIFGQNAETIRQVESLFLDLAETLISMSEESDAIRLRRLELNMEDTTLKMHEQIEAFHENEKPQRRQ